MIKNPAWVSGRAPWYDTANRRIEPVLVGVTGGTTSGKTSICEAIVKSMNIPLIVLLSMDRFYKSLNDKDILKANNDTYNFDHPDAFDMDLFVDTLIKLKNGTVVDVPKYDFITHQRVDKMDSIYGVDVIIIEGILVLYDERIRKLLDLKIYVDTDSDIRLVRRIERDIKIYGRNINQILEQYIRTVKPSFEEFIHYTKKYADIIIPWNEYNSIAINVVSKHLYNIVKKRYIKNSICIQDTSSIPYAKLLRPSELPTNVYVMERTKNLRSIHSYVRDKTLDKDIWLFYLERLVNIVVPFALNYVRYRDADIITPTNTKFSGNKLDTCINIVTITRTGDIFETAIRNHIPNSSYGKIVIQQENRSNMKQGPRLYYAKLSESIQDPKSTVMLFDGVLSTGNAVNMAIQVLLDHGVKQENILLVCLVSTLEGLLRLVT